VTEHIEGRQCAHITNTMATAGDDFEKGHDNGATASLAVAHATAAALTDPRVDFT
jgi:hypothetical protein